MIGKPSAKWNGVNCQDILSRYKNVFQPGLGTLEGYEAKIIVDPEAQPRFCKARSVPYSMWGKAENEVKRLQQEGIIEPIQFAEWAAPIVPVLKSDGKAVRICGDFKLTVNQASKLDRYPIPKIENRTARFLLQYRATPHTTIGMSPAELMFGRTLRTRLDAIKPD